MRVKDLHPRSAITVSPGETLAGASKLLADDDVGALVVFGSGLEGVFSERDLVRAVADGADLERLPVAEYMTSAPVTVDLEGPIGDAIGKMNEFGVRHLVVVDDGDVAAMISVRDLMGLLGTAWPEL